MDKRRNNATTCGLLPGMNKRQRKKREVFQALAHGDHCAVEKKLDGVLYDRPDRIKELLESFNEAFDAVTTNAREAVCTFAAVRKITAVVFGLQRDQPETVKPALRLLGKIADNPEGVTILRKAGCPPLLVNIIVDDDNLKNEALQALEPTIRMDNHVARLVKQGQGYQAAIRVIDRGLHDGEDGNAAVSASECIGALIMQSKDPAAWVRTSPHAIRMMVQFLANAGQAGRNDVVLRMGNCIATIFKAAGSDEQSSDDVMHLFSHEMAMSLGFSAVLNSTGEARQAVPLRMLAQPLKEERSQLALRTESMSYFTVTELIVATRLMGVHEILPRGRSWSYLFRQCIYAMEQELFCPPSPHFASLSGFAGTCAMVALVSQWHHNLLRGNDESCGFLRYLVDLWTRCERGERLHYVASLAAETLRRLHRSEQQSLDELVHQWWMTLKSAVENGHHGGDQVLSSSNL